MLRRSDTSVRNVLKCCTGCDTDVGGLNSLSVIIGSSYKVGMHMEESTIFYLLLTAWSPCWHDLMCWAGDFPTFQVGIPSRWWCFPCFFLVGGQKFRATGFSLTQHNSLCCSNPCCEHRHWNMLPCPDVCNKLSSVTDNLANICTRRHFTEMFSKCPCDDEPSFISFPLNLDSDTYNTHR